MSGHSTPFLDGREHCWRGPRRAFERGLESVREHPRHVGGEATTGDVGQCVDIQADGGDEREQIAGVDARGLHDFLAQRAPEIRDV